MLRMASKQGLGGHGLQGLSEAPALSAAEDSQIKLWDPRASEAITTIFCHKNTVTAVVGDLVAFLASQGLEPNGPVASQRLSRPARDAHGPGKSHSSAIREDIRAMRVRKVFKAHKNEAHRVVSSELNGGRQTCGG